MMHHQVRLQSSGIIPVTPPAEVAPRVKGDLWRRAKPLFPINALGVAARSNRVKPGATRSIPVFPSLNQGDLAASAFIDPLLSLFREGRVHPLAANLQDSAGAFLGINNLEAFFDFVGHGLLAID